ncbi:hypothetical protein O6H91_02G117500 [Diphasiastrum complanatum]|uniref:Uncharacterized protein n=1 Tax=Diphasiastrum complanatum TaxID=34168 RepID=A0ACC2EK47_DIPCM|nr:hypothetical protein O6H91_02G117500 [Diphasiastrum complanatum]
MAMAASKLKAFKDAMLPEPSFQSWPAYRSALRNTGLRFRERVFARTSVQAEVEDITLRSKNKLTKSLNWWDLLWLSIGAVVGAGIFVVTGEQARDVVGPGIIISNVVAGISSMLSVFCYTEFSIEVPVAGGSYAFLRVEMGEFVAFIAAGNILLEYLIGQGAIARAWTSYFATLINKEPDQLRIHTNLANNFNLLDPIAAIVIWISGLAVIFSTRVTSTLNWIASLVNMVVIGFVICGGLTHADIANFRPFLPFGVKGIFSAAAIVYFAYLGFDAVATMAEETKNPARDIPIGLLGSMSIVTVIYCLMALALCLMQKYSDLNKDAPFSFAFRAVGWRWAQYLVALGALKGMTTVLLVGNVSQARYITHMARTHMISPWFAHVNASTHTPIRATVVMLLLASIIGFFTSLGTLTSLLSISTLTIFMLVAVALIIRRYYIPEQTPPATLRLLISLLLIIIAASIGISAYWALSSGWIPHIILFTIWFAATFSIWFFIPRVRQPKVWGVPLVPWIPSLSIGINIFLLGSVDRDSYIRFGVMTVIILLYYICFGLHATYDAAMEIEKGPADSELQAKSFPTDQQAEKDVNEAP